MRAVAVDLLYPFEYNGVMIKILYTKSFTEWIDAFRDNSTRLRLLRRLRRVQDGNFGDTKSVGGGDKSSQNKDINRAKTLAKQLKKEED